jgi:hypothetical protein
VRGRGVTDGRGDGVLGRGDTDGRGDVGGFTDGVLGRGEEGRVGNVPLPPIELPPIVTRGRVGNVG